MPFKADFDKSPIDALADKYGGGGGTVRAFESVISTPVSVTTAAITLDELLINKQTVVVDEDTEVSPDGSRTRFTGTIAPHSRMQIKPSTVQFTTAALTVNDDGVGNLAGVGIAEGSIDYDTGEWVITCDAPPAAAPPNWLVDYTWRFRLPEKVNGLWMFPAGDIRATFSPEGVPTSTTGIEIPADELFDLRGQSTMIRNAKFIAGANTVVDIEVMV